MAGVDEFKKELEQILTKYPDLEMTINIQPRVRFELNPPILLDATKKIIPTNIPQVKFPSNTAKNPEDLEKTITPNKIAEMTKMIQEQ